MAYPCPIFGNYTWFETRWLGLFKIRGLISFSDAFSPSASKNRQKVTLINPVGWERYSNPNHMYENMIQLYQKIKSSIKQISRILPADI
jgi:hypothetical protein